MLRDTSPTFRVWFVLALGSMAPGTMALLSHNAHDVFSLSGLLEFLRVSIFGGLSALFALFVDKPRNPDTSRTRTDDANMPGPPIDDRRRLPDAVVVVPVLPPAPAPPTDK